MVWKRKFFNPFRKQLKKKGTWKPDKTFNMDDHNGWGDTTDFLNYKQGSDTQVIHGHLPHKPRTNDCINVKMQSGSIARFKVLKVNNPGNPLDQFFADVIFINYTKKEYVVPNEGIQIL